MRKEEGEQDSGGQVRAKGRGFEKCLKVKSQGEGRDTPYLQRQGKNWSEMNQVTSGGFSGSRQEKAESCSNFLFMVDGKPTEGEKRPQTSIVENLERVVGKGKTLRHSGAGGATDRV